jgi:DNA-binding NtrC family response regulator
MNNKILIVDDDNLICWGLQKLFFSRGLIVTIAYTGKNAISELNTMPYCLVFLDVHLPDADGMEILKYIKRLSPQTKVILMTGDDSESNRQKALQEGAFSFVAKPFEIRELISLINGLIPCSWQR